MTSFFLLATKTIYSMKGVVYMYIVCVVIITILLGLLSYARHVRRMKLIKKKRLERAMVREAIFEMNQKDVQEMFLTFGFNKSYKIILTRYKRKHGIED